MIREQISGLMTGLEQVGWVVGADDLGEELISSDKEARISVTNLVGLDAGTRPGRLFEVNVAVDLRVRRIDGIEGYLDCLEEVEEAFDKLTALAQSSTGDIRIDGIEMTKNADYRGAVVRLRMIISAL